jgi:hypothetical protein
MPLTPEEMAKREKQLEKEFDKIEEKAKDLGLDKKAGDIKRLESDAGKLAKELAGESD